MSALVRCAHACQVKVVGSFHDFQERRRGDCGETAGCRELDADILKIAVMLLGKSDADIARGDGGDKASEGDHRVHDGMLSARSARRSSCDA